MNLFESLRPKWQATHAGNDYLMWTFGPDAWSGSSWDIDTIKLYRYPDGSWSGRTERDQCIVDDLDQDEIVQIRQELDLDASVEYYL